MRYFRITTPKYKVQILDFLTEQGFEFSPSFHPLIFKLEREPFPLGSSLASYFGLIYIQDKSSFLPALALKPRKGSVVLDLCASPGSKTGLLASLVGEEGLVIANEPNKSRYITLVQNLKRCNHLNVITTSYKAENFPLNIKFEYILLDVPCSGWGTIEKNPRVQHIWNEKKISNLILLQRKLLARASKILDTNGVLVYSTCTTNKQENEEQISWAIDELGLAPIEDKEFCFKFKLEEGKIKGTYKVPMVKGESQGFFIALLKKKDKNFLLSKDGYLKKKKKLDEVNFSDFDLTYPGKFFLFGKKVFFLPKKAMKFLSLISFKGMDVGLVKGKRIEVWNRLRCIEKINLNKICFYDLRELEKLLQGEQILAEEKGILPFFYKDLPLGWVKIRQNRILWQG